MRWWCAWSTRDPRSWALSCVRVWRMLSERSWFGYCTKLLVLRAAISHLPCYFKMSWFWGCILHLPLQGCVSSEASGDTKWELSCCWCVLEELGGREDIVMPISPATCGWKPMVVNVFFFHNGFGLQLRSGRLSSAEVKEIAWSIIAKKKQLNVPLELPVPVTSEGSSEGSSRKTKTWMFWLTPNWDEQEGEVTSRNRISLSEIFSRKISVGEPSPLKMDLGYQGLL